MPFKSVSRKKMGQSDKMNKGWLGAWFRRWHLYVAGGLVLFFMLLWSMGTSAQAPGDLGYPIKRIYERVVMFFVIGREARNDRAASYAVERLNEATELTHRLADALPEIQAEYAQTIQKLLAEYTTNYVANTTTLAEAINEDAEFINNELEDNLLRDSQAYQSLMELRLEAPPVTQATVLQATNALQNNIATAQDALQLAPITPEDSDELSKLVSQGFLTREELTRLIAGATSNRQLLDSLRNLIRSGQLPSNITYAINYDFVQKYASNSKARFAASVTFDEMNKVAIFATIVTPTPEQKQAIQKYLANYKFGDQLPRDETRTFIMPLVYGLNLTPDLGQALKQLDQAHLSPVRKSLYEAWQPLTAGQNASDPKQLYSQALQLTGAATTRSAVLMEQVQLEVLNAVRANVAFLALPPGWTVTQVAAIQDDFAQQIKDLKVITVAQAKAETALNTVADITTPLVIPISEPKVEIIRQIVEKQIVQIQQEFITTANIATDPAAVVPDIEQKITAVQQQLDTQVAFLGNTSGLVNDEIALLRENVKTALESARDAHGKLQEYVVANTDVHALLTSAVAATEERHSQTVTALQERIAQLDATTQAAIAGSVEAVKSTVAGNIASLNEQMAAAGATVAEAQTNMQQNFVANSNHIALLESKLNLTDTAHAILKSQTEQTISQAKTEQQTVIDTLQKQINDSAALRDQLNDAARQEIEDIQSRQTALVSALQEQVNNKQVLKDQLQASIAALQTVQDNTENKVATLSASGQSLTTALQAIKADLDAANQMVKNHVAETAIARSELQKAIDELKSTQALHQTQINDGMEALATQLRQATSQMSATQAQTTLDLAGLSGGLDSVKSSVDSLLNTQRSLQLQLDAQVVVNLELRGQLGQSIAALQKSQVATEAQIGDIKTDVGALKTTVADITKTQADTTTQINGLLAEAVNWRALPGTLQFSQDQFRQYQQQLADEFAAKAAALQQQFEQYKQQLDGTIQQLRTDTSTQLQQLKNEQAALKAQLEQAKQQLQQLESAATPTTTSPTTPSL